MALRKVAQPEDVARQVVVLASDELSGHVSGQLVTAVGAAERSTPVTRTLRFYRITRDGLNAFWLVVDEQGSNGDWLSGGDLALAEIDQDRG